MREELLNLERVLEHVQLPLQLPGVSASRELKAQALHQLRRYLIPRFEQWNAPVIIVVGGSTGSGKSTLVNALVGEEVSKASALRPTTKTPILVHNPRDIEWFASSDHLPGWEKIMAPTEDSNGDLQLVSSAKIPTGIAIIDAPDIDSLVASNRKKARDLFDVADSWIFMTTGMRYADAVPWEHLQRAKARQTVISLVLGRTNPEYLEEIKRDLNSLLEAHELGDTPIFTVTEKLGGAQGQGFVSNEEKRPIWEWLRSFTTDARDDLLQQSMVGAVNDLLNSIQQIDDHLDAQQETSRDLHTVVSENFRADDVMDDIADAVMRGQVLAQWHDFLGTADFLRKLETGVGRVRDRLTRLWRKPSEGKAEVELRASYTSAMKTTAAKAIDSTNVMWEQDVAGRELLESDLRRLDPQFESEVVRQFEEWQRYVLELVSTHGQSKRQGARIAAYGVNAVGLLAMIVAFASTGGLVGAEVAIAGGSAVVAQKVLEAIFGEHGMREIARRAQNDLYHRTTTLLEGQAHRFHAAIPVVPTLDLATAGRELQDALENLSWS